MGKSLFKVLHKYIKPNYSILIAYFSLIFILFSFSVILYTTETNAEISTIEQVESNHISLNREIVFSELSLIYSDILILSERNSIQEFLMNDSINNRQVVEEQFLTLANFSGIYDQVRLINESGTEVIRINYNYSNPFIVPEIDLQNKSQRYYFEDTFSLDKGQVFFSPLDLNIEYGEIEQPLKPMIRIGTPVFDSNNSKRGIVLVNYLADLLLDKLSDTLYGDITMLNSDGYWLRGLDPNEEWGFMYPSNNTKMSSTLSLQHPHNWDEINKSKSGQFYGEEGLLSFDTIYPLLDFHVSSTGSGRPFEPSNTSITYNDYYWKILSIVPNRVINNIRNFYLFRYMLFLAIVLIISSVAIVFLMFINTRRKHTEVELTEQIKAKEELQKSKISLENAQRIARLGNWDWDIVKNKLYWSDEIYRIFGLKPLEFGATYEAFIKTVHPIDRELVQISVDEALYENKPYSIDHSIILSDRSVRIVHEEAEVTFDETGKAIKVVGTVQDITERKKAEEKLYNIMEDLKRSNAELEQFAYVASHDLQEPLRSVASFTQLLQERYKDKLDEDANEFIKFAVDGATRMQNLINDLLLFSRVGKRGKSFKETDMNIVLHAVRDNLSQSIKETNTTITNDPLPLIIADESQMMQLLQNLISNAIKFHGDDPPIIHISAEVTSSEWILSVKDNGIGIDSIYFEKIFIIFQRLHRLGEYEGTGMGLAICKKIAQRHGGKIWVESAGNNKGSTFMIKLPIKYI